MKLVSIITIGVLVASLLLCSCALRQSEIRDKTHAVLAQLERALSVDEEMQCVERLRAIPRARAYYETVFADGEGNPVSKEEFYRVHNADQYLPLKVIFRYTTANGKSRTFVRTFLSEEAFKFYFLPH